MTALDDAPALPLVRACRRRKFRRPPGLGRATALAGAVLALLTSEPASRAMDFHAFTFDDGTVGIAAVGRISGDAPQGFLRSLQDASSTSRRVTVFLDSPGGDVRDSMELGRLFRTTGVSAEVARVGRNGASAGECFSACVYALMGARRRAVPPQSQVGIHRMVATEELAGEISEATSPELRAEHSAMRSILARYASRMGVDPGLIFSAERVSSERLHVLSQAEIQRWHLAGPHL